MEYRPKLILVDATVRDLPVTRHILDHYSSVESQIVSSAAPVIERLQRGRHPHAEGKRILYLTRHQGTFLKSCPGICDHVTCCNYHIIDLGTNCPLECTYCVLQSYLNNPLMVIYTNIEELLEELEAALTARPGEIVRVGTGELTDSLALDSITGLSRRLVPFFASHPRAFLELKTKTTEIGQLQDLDPKGQTVISWSLNTPRIIAGEELKTSSLEERLGAARQCAEWGYQIGFHFDPIIDYPGWEADYRETIDKLYAATRPRKIAWISMGALRLPPGLRSVMQDRFPASMLPLGEFITGADGKGRYFRPRRIEMYRNMAAWIQEHRGDQTIYLCMESPLVWSRALGKQPSSTEVSASLDSSLATAMFPLTYRHVSEGGHNDE